MDFPAWGWREVGLDGGSPSVFCCRSYLKTTPCAESSNWEFAVEDSFCGIILMVGESGREWLRVLCLLGRKPGKAGYLKVKIGANQLLLSFQRIERNDGDIA